MELFIRILFTAITFVYSYHFILALVKMKQPIILPTSEKELAMIRKYPEKMIHAPTYTKQKNGIIMYALFLSYMIIMFILGSYFLDFYWTLYLLFILPVLFHLSNLLNMFAFTQDGVLCGARFVPWKKIKSFEFVRIDINHRYYGFSKEVNDQYELKIKTRSGTFSCIVTSNEMKERLRFFLDQQKIAELHLEKDILY